MPGKRRRGRVGAQAAPGGALDLNRIVQTAITLLNESGLQRLSMRTLADALGVRAASLYWHIRDKAELCVLIADKVCEDVDLSLPESSWEEQLTMIARSYRAALLKVRDSEQILADSPPFSPMRLQLIETVCRWLADAGVPREEVLSCGGLFNNYVLTSVQEERIFRRMAEERGGGLSSLLASGQAAFHDLPVESYPMLASLAQEAGSMDPEVQFHFGLRVILDGISSRIRKSEKANLRTSVPRNRGMGRPHRKRS